MTFPTFKPLRLGFFSIGRRLLKVHCWGWVEWIASLARRRPWKFQTVFWWWKPSAPKKRGMIFWKTFGSWNISYLSRAINLLWIVAAPPSMEAGFSHGVGIDTLFATPPKKSSKMKTLQFHQTPPLSSHFIAVWGLRYNGGRASKYSCRGTRCVGCRKMIQIGLENQRMISMCGKSWDTAIQLASVYFILIYTHCKLWKHVPSLYNNWKMGIYGLMFPLNTIAFIAVDQP